VHRVGHSGTVYRAKCIGWGTVGLLIGARCIGRGTLGLFIGDRCIGIVGIGTHMLIYTYIYKNRQS
jgi:hypothetical protein